MSSPYVTDSNLTEVVMQRWQDIPDPRLREVMQSLIKHLHGFVKEVKLTQPEWLAAIMWLTRTGQICDEKRQEFIRAVRHARRQSMLVDSINNRLAGGATPSTVEGPFHMHDAPTPRTASMAKAMPQASRASCPAVVTTEGQPGRGCDARHVADRRRGPL